MGNNPSKPESSSKGISSPIASPHGQPGAPVHRKHHSRRETSSSANAPPDSPSIHDPHALTPPRKPSLKPQQFIPASSSSSARREFSMGNSQSQEPHHAKKKESTADSHSDPVQVPTSAHQTRRRPPDVGLETSAAPGNPDYVPATNLNFPPRLPLPIQEEIYTPGSPIITPDDLSTALREDEEEGTVGRPTSLLSHTTLDEDEEAELQDPATKGKAVPTTIQWAHGGSKVYITGTFTNWSKKFRMHRTENPNILSATIDLPPGTHHVKFIVDGEMRLSPDLPTAVDYTNVLVNYVEVSADDIPKDDSSTKYPYGVHPPMSLPSGVETTDFEPTSTTEEPEQPEETHQIISTKNTRYGTLVPRYLTDLDYPPETRRFQRAAEHVQDIPTPPSLPLFLNKSILNGAMPMKDDSSVLIIPNHTVLNHLATSSIKNDVLATSLTTRYRRKYVTTIIYRATTDDDDHVANTKSSKEQT